MVVLAAVVAGVPPAPRPAPAEGATAAGLVDEIVLRGLELPTDVEFAPDGTVFVAEKSGLLKVFSGLGDPTASVFADLRTETHSLEDRGLLGLAVDPAYPASPHVYVAYSRDAPVGGTPPRWGSHGGTYDASCPNPVTAGCPASSRIVRLTGDGERATASKVLVDGFCQQPFSHSIGDLVFGPDGSLYGAHGDGASSATTDYGQFGNPCGDPPGSPGRDLSAPTAEGGALRSQDLRTGGDPLTLNGSLFRIDPDTGEGVAGNPLASSADPNARRILAHGLRNPFRFALRPGTSEVWVGDVGWLTWEEIDRVAPSAPVENLGWPCYEGPARQPRWDAADLDLCESLYDGGGVTPPHFAYAQTNQVVPGGACPAGGEASNGGMAFYTGARYPAKYRDGLFFADYARDCIYVMRAGADGLPSKGLVEEVVVGAPSPVDLEVGPDGDLFYVDIVGGTVHRLRAPASGVNQPPVAVAAATPTSGEAPLTVTFDASGSHDPDGDALTYAWDLDGDGAYDDATGVGPSRTYSAGRAVHVGLRVRDPSGATATATVRIDPGNTAPVPVIDAPDPALAWQPGDTIAFAGHATDAEDRTVARSRLSWTVDVFHCEGEGSCHLHPVTGASGVARGSVQAPEHAFPSYLQIRLTATDAAGLSASTQLHLAGGSPTAPPPPAPAAVAGVATPSGGGVWVAHRDAAVQALGDAPHRGDMAGAPLNAPIVDMDRTASGGGYYLLGGDGGVFSFGEAPFLGSTGGLPLNQPVVGMATHPRHDGYWFVAADGGVFAYGASGFAGSMGGSPLNQPVVDMAATASGLGYWLVARDGGIFSFGDALFSGSTGGMPLNRPIVGMAADPDGVGYWFVAEDGGVFSFDAPFSGSAVGALAGDDAVVAMAPHPVSGYWLFTRRGGVLGFGDAGGVTRPPA